MSRRGVCKCFDWLHHTSMLHSDGGAGDRRLEFRCPDDHGHHDENDQPGSQFSAEVTNVGLIIYTRWRLVDEGGDKHGRGRPSFEFNRPVVCAVLMFVWLAKGRTNSSPHRHHRRSCSEILLSTLNWTHHMQISSQFVKCDDDRMEMVSRNVCVFIGHDWLVPNWISGGPRLDASGWMIFDEFNLG